MSDQQQPYDRGLQRYWILATGVIVLLLAAGIWFILDRFAAQNNSHVDPVTVVENEADVDQSQAVSSERGDIQDSLESFREDTDVESDPAASLGRSDGQDSLESFREDTDVESDPAASLGRSDGQDSLESSREDTDVESDPIATQPPPQADLGLEDIVREYILGLWGGETVHAESDYIPSTYAKLESADLETRRRGDFELAVRVHFISREADDPYYLLLQSLQDDDWWSCLMEYGVPSLEEFGPLTPEQQDAVLEELGLVGEKMEQLVDDCWSRARIYAGKDEETDRLLELQHEYYLKAAQDWVQENPDSVVPLPDGG